jgi:hypothetical protein
VPEDVKLEGRLEPTERNEATLPGVVVPLVDMLALTCTPSLTKMRAMRASHTQVVVQESEPIYLIGSRAAISLVDWLTRTPRQLKADVHVVRVCSLRV